MPNLTPSDLFQALLSLPLFSLVLAALVTVAIVLVRPARQTAPPERYRPELRALGIVAIAVIVAFAVENVVRGYLLQLPDVVDWWRYPTPLFAAFVGLVIAAALIVARGSARPELPAAPTARRGFTTFGPRAGILLAALSIAALLLVTVLAGIASSSDRDGRFIYLEVGAPNTDLDPLRPWFYGWSYGVPVIICTVALAAALWFVLARNATRPYLRPELVPAEQDARRRVASAATSIATAATLLALGGALRFIERSGTISQVTTGDNETYDLVWRYAPLAEVAGWIAPALEVAGFTLLLLCAVRSLRRPLAPQPEPVLEEATR